MRRSVLFAALAAGLLGGAAAVAADTVAVLGTGRVGAALGPQFARQGMTVIYGSREPQRDDVQALVKRTGNGARAATSAEAVANAQYVVVALPWSATESTLRGLNLDGRIIIDPTNAIRTNPQTKLMEMAVETSGAERIQALAPRARVVKAFNAVGSHVMADAAAGNGPVTIPLVGDDAAAKAAVARLIEKMGLETLDVGPLRNARALEGLSILYMVPYLSGRRQDAFEIHLRKGAAPRQSQGVRPARDRAIGGDRPRRAAVRRRLPLFAASSRAGLDHEPSVDTRARAADAGGGRAAGGRRLGGRTHRRRRGGSCPR
jgi:8-hydroxy-5-deazaflavin:NADPH oxidoreductase